MAHPVYHFKPEAYHSVKVPYTFGRNPFVLMKNRSKIFKNPTFVRNLVYFS